MANGKSSANGSLPGFMKATASHASKLTSQEAESSSRAIDPARLFARGESTRTGFSSTPNRGTTPRNVSPHRAATPPLPAYSGAAGNARLPSSHGKSLYDRQLQPESLDDSWGMMQLRAMCCICAACASRSTCLHCVARV